MNETNRWWPALVALIAIAAGAYWYLTRPQVEAPAEVSSLPEAPSTEAIRNPIENVAPGVGAEGDVAQEIPPLDQSDSAVEGSLADLFGEGSAAQVVSSGDYIRKFVVTVDNLARRRASARMWPVQRTPGALAVREEDDRTYLSEENFQRYEPFVRLATSADVDRLVAWYVRYYPLFQQAYEGLGYPGQYFNDRLVDVIDNLLATPEPSGPIELVLPPQDPSVELGRPWVLYQYADPSLESLSAGQKILVRMGNENARRLKLMLGELRTRLKGQGSGRAAPP